MHLCWEPGARVDAIGFAEGIRYLIDINGIQKHPHADPEVLLSGVLNDDEFTFFGIREVAEEGEAVCVFFRGGRSGADGMRLVQRRARVVHQGRLGGAADGRGWGVGGAVGGGVDVGLADVVGGGGAVGGSMVVVMGFV